MDVRERHRAVDLLVDGRRVVGVEAEDPAGRRVEARARLVVGADGRASMAARALGLVRSHRLRRMALVQDVEGLAGFQGRGEIYVDPPDYAILNPVAPGRVNASLVVPLAHAREFSGRLEAFFAARVKQVRALSLRLAAARPVGRLMAMGPLAYRVAEPRHGGIALVGDAAGFYDPFTGEGLFAALRSAELLAEVAHAALRRDDVSVRALAPYAAARRRVPTGAAHAPAQLAIRHRAPANGVAHALARRPRARRAHGRHDFVPARTVRLAPWVARRWNQGRPRADA